MVQPMSADQSLDPQAAAAIARVRRLMLIASVTTFVALAFVLGVIGYRVFHMGERAIALKAPGLCRCHGSATGGRQGAFDKIGNDHIVVTIEVGGVTELRTFDPDTLKPLGRLRLEQKP